MSLLFINKVPASQRDDFAKAVKLISAKYKINPNWLMALMNSETGGTFKADQYNLAGSGAVGLIQFMPSTAKTLGTTTSELANMSEVQQLAWVDKYIAYTMKNVAKVDRIRDYDDLYLLIFYPKAVGEKDSFVIGKQGGAVYSQNKGIDANGDGLITVSDFKTFIRKKIPTTDLWQFIGRNRYRQIYWAVGAVVFVALIAFAYYKGWFRKAFSFGTGHRLAYA